MFARCLALAAILATTAALGCSPSPELSRVRVPKEGVTLSYRLATGTGFEGTVQVGNTLEVPGLDEPLSQSATADVTMAVLGPVAEGTELRATFNSVDLDWDLAPSATYSSGELLELVQERVRGMQVRFVVRPDGRLQALPRPPADTPLELAEVIETLVRGLEAFFIPLPAEPLQHREAWVKPYEHTNELGVVRAMEHEVTLDGMFRLKQDPEVTLARLSIEQRRTEAPDDARDVHQVSREVRALMMFSPNGYPAELDRETRQFNPDGTLMFRKVRSSWAPLRGQLPERLAAPAEQGGDVQVITDPCNADYVGPEVCTDAAEDAPPAVEARPTEPDAEPAAPDEPPPTEPDAEATADDAAPSEATPDEPPPTESPGE